MIRINLIPVSKVRKREPLIIQAVVGAILLILIAVGCYFLGSAKHAKIVRLERDVSIKEREIEELKAKVGEVEKFKNKEQTLQQQINVIRSLESARKGPVKMMDELTEIIPRKLWFEQFKESNNRVTIEGVAESGAAIADFLERIKTAKYFSNPDLQVAQGVEQDGMHLHKFTITVNVRYDL